jgi:small-conductance mechanosensitive channel
VVIVPNSKVAQSVITNFDLDEPRMALPIAVAVGYDADPDRVEALLVDEALRAVGEVQGLLPEPRPAARLIPGFGAYSLDFTLVCWVARFSDQFNVQHELRKRLLKRLRAENIEIPFPTAVRLQGREVDGR